MSFKKNQAGFSIIELVIILVVLGVLGFVGWRFLTSSNSDGTEANQSQNESQTPSKLIWQQTPAGWQASETPPTCASQPMLKAPTDLSAVTSVLYPGQTRGGNYKPHGGFRFDNSTENKVTVTAPIDAYLVRGGRYIAEGEIQYTFDAMNNCGIMYRVGHLRELPANLQQIADTWPTPTANSATQAINPTVMVKQGEVLATKVGIIGQHNTFFDWGVYDYRQENEASKSAAYQAAHANEQELAWHAVCWLQGAWLPGSDQAALAALPAGDPTSAKKSDYCK